MAGFGLTLAAPLGDTFLTNTPIIRNLVINLLKRAGYHNIAEGRRAAAWNHNGLALNILRL